jgi:hypothetical protein
VAIAKDAAGATGDNTVVGQSILISGKLTGDEDLTVRTCSLGRLVGLLRRGIAGRRARLSSRRGWKQ